MRQHSLRWLNDSTRVNYRINTQRSIKFPLCGTAKSFQILSKRGQTGAAIKPPAALSRVP